MGRFLVLYLVVTGVISAVVLSAPSLVILGLFLFILPGLILGLMPTAFLWGAIFSAAWFGVRRWTGPWVASVAGVAATVAVVLGVPKLVNPIIDARVAALRLGDGDPAGLIPLEGVVAFERTSYDTVGMDDAEWKRRVEAFRAAGRRVDWSERPLACDVLCAAALFTPGVDAVVVRPVAAPGSTRPPEPRPWQFHLERAPGCAGSLAVANRSVEGLEDSRALIDAWRIRTSEGACIRRSRATARPDATIALSDWRVEGSKSSSPFAQPSMSVLRLEIRDAADRVLLRRTRVRTARLAKVLSITADGSLESFSFHWARERARAGKEPGAFTPAGLLAQATPLRLGADPRAVADAARTQLARSLADPARPAGDPAFALPERIFEDIRENGLRPGDGELVERIVADPRTRELGRVWDPIRRMGEDAVRLRHPIVRRILAADYPGETEVDTLGRALEALPEGAFARPTADELALLNDPGRRNWATGLVERQADRGAEAAPLLTRILVEGWSAPEPDEGERDLDAAEAARKGLCVLGPAARSALPAVEQLISTGALPQRRLDEREWQVTLARLGRPIGSFRSAPNSSWSDAQQQAWLRRRLEKFDPRRDCR